MSEHPILLSGDEVRDVLAGRKTQVQRPIRPQPERHIIRLSPWFEQPQRWIDADGTNYEVTCPYGQAGDVLWVREAWQVCPANELIPGEYTQISQWNPAQRVVYRATVPSETHPEHPEWGRQVWRPSVHMPRWASRITREVTAVRVERLSDAALPWVWVVEFRAALDAAEEGRTP